MPFLPTTAASQVDKGIKSYLQYLEELEHKAIIKQQIHDKNLVVLLKRKAVKVTGCIAPREYKAMSSRQTTLSEA